MPDLFDSHCHLQDPRFRGRLPEVLERARRAGVGPMVCCATREADWDPVLELAREHPDVLPMLGLHPWFADRAAPGWEDRLERRLGPARAGIGECGLDFSPGRPAPEAQEAALAAQLRLARRLELPVYYGGSAGPDRGYPSTDRQHGTDFGAGTGAGGADSGAGVAADAVMAETRVRPALRAGPTRQ